MLGEYAENNQACGVTERMRQIANDFEQAGVPIQLAEDLLIACWKKLVWNTSFNGLSVVLNATTNVGAFCKMPLQNSYFGKQGFSSSRVGLSGQSLKERGRSCLTECPTVVHRHDSFESPIVG